MPYKSDAQRRKFHAMFSRGEIKKSVVDEYDRASKGKKLPERVRRRKYNYGGLVNPMAGESMATRPYNETCEEYHARHQDEALRKLGIKV